MVSGHQENEHSSHQQDNLRRNIRQVADVSWPIVIGMLSYTAMGVTDTLLVGWVGKTELAAVGLGTTAVFLINAFFVGSIHGVKVVSAQATGAGKHDVASSAAWHGMAIAVIFGIIAMALAGVGPQIFALMGGSQEVQDLACQYFQWRIMASPFWYVTIALCDYYQGTGDTRTPMKLNLLTNGLNIGLDLVMIFGLGPIPAMGVKGAALATAIASVLSMVILLGVFLRKHRRPAQFDMGLVEQIGHMGLPIGVRYVLNVCGFTVFTSMLAHMGEDELAANQIAFKILSLSFLPGYGISEAACVLTGQHIGAGQPHKARGAFNAAMVLSVGIMGVFGVIFWMIPHTLIGIFQNDQQVLEIGTELLMVAAFFQIFDAVAMTATGALNGAGDTRFTMVASVMASWFVLVPAAYTFGVVLEMGATGAWLGMTFEIIALAAVMTWRFHTGAWKDKATAVAHKPAAAAA